MMKSEQLKMIESLEQKLNDALTELEELKANILHPIPMVSENDTNEKTLLDVYRALKNINQSNANRLRIFCQKRGIDTLEQLLMISPSELKKTEGIGVYTLQQIEQAIDSLGIVWNDIE